MKYKRINKNSTAAVPLDQVSYPAILIKAQIYQQLQHNSNTTNMEQPVLLSSTNLEK